MKYKRGLSGIITTLIIILLIIAAAAIIWAVVKPFVKGGVEEISLDKLKIDLNIENAYIDENNDIGVSVERGSDEGELVKIKFIITDGQNSDSFENVTTMGPGEMQTFTFASSLFENILSDNAQTVSVAPIYLTDSGNEELGDITSTFDLSTGTVIGGGDGGDGGDGNDGDDGGDGGEEAICGDGEVGGIEQCDGGINCGEECVCELGYGPTSPVSVDCQILQSCGDAFCDLEDGETPETCPQDCEEEVCTPDCSGTSCNTREPNCGAMCLCEEGEVCLEGVCVVNLISSGTVSSVWPGSAPKYFDSSNLPRDGSESDLLLKYINISSAPSICCQIYGVEHVVEGGYDMTHVELDRVASTMSGGDNYQIWRTDSCSFD